MVCLRKQLTATGRSVSIACSCTGCQQLLPCAWADCCRPARTRGFGNPEPVSAFSDSSENRNSVESSSARMRSLIEGCHQNTSPQPRPSASPRMSGHAWFPALQVYGTMRASGATRVTRPRSLETAPLRSHFERSRLAVNKLMSESELSCSFVISMITPAGCSSPTRVAS